MQLRELLKNQQILTSNVSAKSNQQYVEWDAFSEILNKKSIQPEPKNTPVKSKIDLYKEGYETNQVKPKISVKSNQFEETPVAKEPIGSTTKEVDTVSQKPVQDKQVSKKENSDSSEVKDTDKIKQALKDKLKKITGLDDEKLDSLLAMMNLSVADLEKMVSNAPEAAELLSTLSDMLETLEIDLALENGLTKVDLVQMTSKLNQMIQTLEKIQDSSKEQSTGSDENGFEMKLIQGLSKLVDEINAKVSDTQEDVKPNDIRKSLVDAMAMMPQNSDGKENKIQSEALIENDTMVLTTQVATESESSLNQQEDSKDSSKGEVPIKQTTSVSSTQVNNPVNASLDASKMTEAMVQKGDIGNDVVVETTSIGNHQITMKQSNGLTSQVIQVTPQLRADVFNQILEAVKGQIRLSEHGTAMVVKLQPEQLGNVELKLNIHKGAVLAEIKVENEIVKATIESNLDNLKQSLSDKGYEVSQINVQVDSGKKESQPGFSFDGQPRKNNQNSSNEKAEHVEAVASITRYELNELDGSTINIYG